MSWAKSDDIVKREQDLEEISRLLLNSELPSIGCISESVRNLGEADKNSQIIETDKIESS